MKNTNYFGWIIVILILVLGYFLFIDGSDRVSSSNSFTKKVNQIKQSTVGKSREDCRKECEDSFALIGYDVNSINESIQTMFRYCIDECYEKQEPDAEQERKARRLIKELQEDK